MWFVVQWDVRIRWGTTVLALLVLARVMCSLAAWDRSGWRDDGVPKADELSFGESEGCTRRYRVRDRGQNDWLYLLNDE